MREMLGRRVARSGVLVGGLLALFFGGLAGSASAATAKPHLSLQIAKAPTVFSTSDNAACLSEQLCDAYHVTVTNTGSETAEGTPIDIGYALPSNVVVSEVQMFRSEVQTSAGPWPFEPEGSCTTTVCESSRSLAPDESLQVMIKVQLEPGAVSGEAATFTVTENGVAVASATATDEVGAPDLFGPEMFSASLTGIDGAADTQAGGHPYEMQTTVDLNNDMRVGPGGPFEPTSIEDPKDIVVDLPVGFFGSALATPKCTMTEMASRHSCPVDTRIGHIFSEPLSNASINSYVYNLVPEHGVAAEFGYTDELKTTHAIYASVAPTKAGYVLRATTPDIPEVALTNATVTLFGNPAAKDESAPPAALFTNPSQCTGKPLVTTVHMDSWEHPGSTNGDGTPNVEGPGWVSSESESPAVTGCNLLHFAPSSFATTLDTQTADSPTGLTFDLQIPQSEEPATPATPPLKDATVTLPAGVIVNPAAAGGLEACSPAQIGWLGGSVTNFSPGAPTCPEASKIGTVEVTSPAIASTLVGSIYLASQNDNPLGSLLAGYIVIDDPTTGVIVKIAGKLTLNEQSGQITGTFDENPQLPFSDLKLRFFGGTRGELATPEGCGTYTTHGELEPWSAPDSGPNAQVSDSFAIDNGCVSGFAPGFSAGTISAQAGEYSPFTLTFSRQDSEEEISALTVTLPPGLEGKLAGITQCPEADIAAAEGNPSGAAERANPSCPAGSQIGTVEASAGVGTQPFSLPGTAYLTGPYKGGPYGIAVVVPAVAGPLDLGNVVVRSSLQINPTDAHVTITSDSFPTIIDRGGDGFPIRLRSVIITVNRPGFTLNPTSCTPMSVSATLTSVNGASVPVSSRFQASGCRSLPFHPGFAVATLARTSKKAGASLNVKVSSSNGQANIAKVHIALPRQLPSRLSTLQKACLASVFNVNPAACPPESVVGSAIATTPLLSSPLVGPAYIVSHGGAAFPDTEIVLQGEGITLILDGNTDIKKGITTSTFNTVPDAPVSKFELTLPEGPHSILAPYLPAKAKYSMCGQSLSMPTTITGQSGATVTQTTKIQVTGCPKAKKAAKIKKHKSTKKTKNK